VQVVTVARDRKTTTHTRTTAARGLGYAWQQLTKRAYALYGRDCHLRLPGCTHYADTVDHLDSRAVHGTALPSIDRVRPACRHCNTAKSNKERAARRRRARIVRRRLL
jgi:5-methylcytosine-specific restriction endonuclease McrA